MSMIDRPVVFATEDLLLSLCNAVSAVLGKASGGEIRFSPMVQKISKTCLKPDIGCFVLFDGGFSGLVVMNFSAAAALELYRNYLLSMGLAESELATSHTSDDVSNVMGELMNQIVGDFTGRIGRELQVHITQSQPKMLALNKQVILSVDTRLDQPETRRVTFYTAGNKVFYLELAVDRTEFIALADFEPEAPVDPELLLERGSGAVDAGGTAVATDQDDAEALLKSLGM